MLELKKLSVPCFQTNLVLLFFSSKGCCWILFFQRFMTGLQKTLSKILNCACQVCYTVLWGFVCVFCFLIILETIFFKIKIEHLCFSVLPR